MITIRPANKNEVKDFQNLNDEIFIDNQKYDPDIDMGWAQSDKGKEYFTQLLNDPDGCCFIAEENGRKVGYIAGGPKEISYCKSRYMEIKNMGVIPKYRLQSIGARLMDECLKWAKSKGFQKAFVCSYFGNKIAIKFYKRKGFSEIDISLERDI